MDKQFSAGPIPAKLPPDHQRQVDAMQAAIRSELVSGQRSLFKPPPPRPAPSTNPLDHRIAEEMEFIVRQLEQLGAILANDPILLRRHAVELQSIDLMKQSLRHLAQVVAAEDKALAADQVTLTELKSKLQRKALRPIGDGQGAA
jgi:regulator of protease activity HflC (stomatin/prohibitin superfamily)